MDIDDALEFTEADNLDLIFSICNDPPGFINKLPESPPDSEHLLSPGNYQQLSPTSGNPNAGFDKSSEVVVSPLVLSNQPNSFPDLNKVDFRPALQLIQNSEPDLHQAVIENHGGQQDGYTAKKPKMDFTVHNSTIKVEPPDAEGFSNNGKNIEFGPFDPDKWNATSTIDLSETRFASLSVTADKGFNYSTADDAFIVQKKNHFQITCTIKGVQDEKEMHYVHTIEGLKEIASLRLNLYGVKLENTDSRIKVEQSQSNRSKQKLDPIPVHISGKETKVSAGRLHFSETTSYNMRKKGKPNPAQKYFRLMVSLEAMASEVNGKSTEYPLAMSISDRIIVRASNPGQFESDTEVLWSRNENDSGTVYHLGKVGINTEHAKEALAVRGNIQLTGSILQPSDIRLKNKIREVDSEKQLRNVNNIKIVNYQYKPEFLQPDESNQEHTGVIAQNIQDVLPDAVHSSGNYVLDNGRKIDNMLIVNKDRLFLENIGAVRQLSKVTDKIERRIVDLEKATESIHLARLKRSTSSCTSSISSSSVPKSRKTKKNLFSYRAIQGLILGLVLIIALSMVAITTIYIMNYYYRDSSDSSVNETSIHYRTQKPNNSPPKVSPTVSPAMTKYSRFKTTTTTTTTTSWKSSSTQNPPLIIGANPTCSVSVECPIFCCLKGGRRNSGEEANPINSVDNNLTASLDDSSSRDGGTFLSVFPGGEKNDEKIMVKLYGKNWDINEIYPSSNNVTFMKRHPGEDKRRPSEGKMDAKSNETSDVKGDKMKDKPSEFGAREIRSAEFDDPSVENSANEMLPMNPIIRTNHENYTLDHRYRKDSTLNQFDYNLLLSKHFGDPSVEVIFPPESNLILCAVPEGDYCVDWNEIGDSTPVNILISGSVFDLNISQHKISRFRFRVGSVPNLCGRTNDKHLFQEYNLVFARQCE